MRVVTTCHKQGFEDYGFRCLESFKNWPKGTEFIWYTEGYDLPAMPGVKVEQRDIRGLLPLVNFKERLKHFVPPDWRWDVVKFSHKVFAAVDALADVQEGYDGLGVWLDADCVTHRKIPKGYIERLIKGKYFACFRRRGLFTETGFWMVDCSHPYHHEFFGKWQGVYENDLYDSLPQWHDCMTLDALLKANERAGSITVENLSGRHEKDMHPMAKVDLARYIDHCKGPRKRDGVSPENEFRKTPARYVARPNGAALERARPGDEVY